MMNAIRIAGADPASHEALTATVEDPSASVPTAMKWGTRILEGMELRDVETTDSLSMIRGIAVPYNTWAPISWYLERWAPGALSRSIDEAKRVGRELPLNLFHDGQSFPVAVASEWSETAEGLVGTWRLADTERAQEAARYARDGFLTGLSIEFQALRAEWDLPVSGQFDPALGVDYMDRCTRTEARLGATAICQTPAFVSAGVQFVRTAPAPRTIEGTPWLDRMRTATDTLRNA